MGELDKFSGKGISPAGSKGLTKSGVQTPQWAKDAKPRDNAAAEKILQGVKGRFAIALDATGSMASLIDMAKRSIREILTRVMREAGGPVEIMLVAYRDYDVPKNIVISSTPTKDHNALTSWLEKVEVQGR